jgi:putative transposase
MSSPAAKSPYAGYRFPAEIISHAVWLYFRFPLSLRHVDEILAARGVAVNHETVRQRGLKFGQGFASQIRRRLPRAGDKWHLDEVVVKVSGVQHWLWRAVDQDGTVLGSVASLRAYTDRVGSGDGETTTHGPGAGGAAVQGPAVHG